MDGGHKVEVRGGGETGYEVEKQKQKVEKILRNLNESLHAEEHILIAIKNCLCL